MAEHENELAAEIVSVFEGERFDTMCQVLSCLLEITYAEYQDVDHPTACRWLSKAFRDMAAKRKVDWSFKERDTVPRRRPEQRPPTAEEVNEAHVASGFALQANLDETVRASNIAQPDIVGRALLVYLVGWINKHEKDFDKSLRIAGQMLKSFSKQRYVIDRHDQLVDIETRQVVSPATVN
jgi:hypothetical protein